MTSRAIRRLLRSLLFICWLTCLSAVAQQPADRSSSAPAGQSAQAEQPPKPNQPSAAQQQPENPNAAIGRDLAGSAAEASGEGKEENAQFKYSKSVVWLGHLIGLGPHASYMLSWGINFVLVIVFFLYILKSPLPKMFRERTAAIQKGIREAQAASADAARRLSDIEARLARLDTEVTQIRTGAEHDIAVEAERIRQAAEQDKHKVVEAAEAEITAIARNARRELKTYAASLAVDLASRKIHVNDASDRVLVREFVDQLGKDGK